jgi:hypothetical protein
MFNLGKCNNLRAKMRHSFMYDLMIFLVFSGLSWVAFSALKEKNGKISYFFMAEVNGWNWRTSF